MADFKGSNLISVLKAGDMLTQDAWDFIDACMDDFCVDEYHDNNPADFGGIWYELRGMFHGYHNGREVSVTQIYEGDLSGMVAIIEHLALTHTLLMKHNGIGIDE